MRPPDDDGLVDPAGTQLSSLFGTEKSDRPSENMDRPPPNPKAPGGGLTALLNQQQPAGQPAPVAQSPADEQFTMQVIRGTEISQTEFTRKFDAPTHWANGSLGNESTGDPKPETVAPAAGKKVEAKPSDDHSKSNAAKPQDGSNKGNSDQDHPVPHA